MNKELHDKDEVELEEEDITIDIESNNSQPHNISQPAVITPKPTPIPWVPVLIITLIHISDNFSFSTLAPYITDLVIDLGLVPDNDKKKVGYWAGIIGSSYYVSQFFSALMWGWVSDKYGRRRVMLCGIAGGFISSLLFGFSKNIYWCLIVRLFFGFANGNLGTSKIILSEISDKTNQARVFSTLGVSFSIGSIVGPLLGGFLASPMTQYPKLATILPEKVVWFFTYFPFASVNLIVAAMNLFSFIFGFFFLKETNKKLLAERSKAKQSEVEVMESVTPSDDHGENTIDSAELITRQSDAEPGTEIVVDREVEMHEGEDHSLFKNPESHESEVKQVPLSVLSWKDKFKFVFKNEIFQTRFPLIFVFLYASIGYISVAFAEVMPLFLVLKVEDGGVNFSMNNIGTMNAAAGVLMLFWQLLVVPIVIKRVGASLTFKITTAMIAPCYVIFPLMNFLSGIKWLMWTCLILTYAYRYAISQVMFSSINMLVNNSVSSANMGKLNGLGQSSVAAGRAIAPYLSGVIFAWSLTNKAFPFNIFLIWILLTLMTLLTLPLTFGWPKSIDYPMIEVSDIDEDHSK